MPTTIMAQLLNKTRKSQIIGGIFSSLEHVVHAKVAFQGLSISEQNIQVIQLNGLQNKEPYTNYLVKRGFDRFQARYYDKALRVGKILVALYDVTDTVPVTAILDKHRASYRLGRKQSVTLNT